MRRHVLHFLSPKYISTVCFRLFCALCTKSTQKTPIYSMHSEAKCGLENQFINFFSKCMLPVCTELEIYLMTLLWLKCIQRCIELEIYLITLLWHIPTCFMHKMMMAMPGTSIVFSLLSWCVQIGTWTLVLCTVHGGLCPIAATINSSSFFLTLPLFARGNMELVTLYSACR